MTIRISQATIIDQNHPDNGKKKDLLIVDGIINKIADHLSEEADEVLSAEGLCVSIGWMDMRANFREPGDEHKEDLQSGLAAAANGGFTAVALMPSTTPPIDNKSSIQFLLNRSSSSAVEIIPIGTVSKGLHGESLAEMYDMKLAGALAFTDDKNSIKESGLLNRALLYARNFNAVVIHFPYDSTLVSNGQINEGIQSTLLGLKGIPAIAEEMCVRRDLTLLKYTEGSLHLAPISCSGSLTLIDEAKKQGLKISCEVTAAHLVYNEGKLSNFDTVYKVLPPLRDEKNRLKLIEGLKKGIIDVISSDHSPEDEEHKKLEFDYASFGMAAQEMFFPMLYTALQNEVALDLMVAKFSKNPRQILGLEMPKIAEGEPANLTLFSTQGKTEIKRENLHTKGVNIPELNNSKQGRVLGIVNRKQFVKTRFFGK